MEIDNVGRVTCDRGIEADIGPIVVKARQVAREPNPRAAAHDDEVFIEALDRLR